MKKQHKKQNKYRKGQQVKKIRLEDIPPQAMKVLPELFYLVGTAIQIMTPTPKNE